MDIKSELKEFRDDYPYDDNLFGYQMIFIFPILGVLTYVVTLTQYSPYALTEMIVAIPLLVIIIPLIVTTEEHKDIQTAILYIVKVFVILITAYSVYAFSTQLLSLFVPNSGFITEVIWIIIRLLTILTGTIVTAIFYYTLYIYYQIVDNVSQLEDSQTEQSE